VAAAPRRRPITSLLWPEVLRRLLPRCGGRAGDLHCRSLPSRGGGLRRRPWPRRPANALRPCPLLSLCVVVLGRAPAHRVVFSVRPAPPEKSAIGSCLGRQPGTTADTARHEKAIGPHRVGPNWARDVLGPGGPFGIL
jgi:hypothetical protein